jgi:DNA-binding NarL/FixJ family response regulator
MAGWAMSAPADDRADAMTGAPVDPITAAVIEDRPDLRSSLAQLIDGTPGFRCTGAYRSMEEALPHLERGRPQIVLVDIVLPGMSGIEGTRVLKARYPELMVLALTIYDDDERIFDALCAGCSGYLLKDTPPARLLEGLREAVSGGAPMSPGVASRVVALFRTFRPPRTSDTELTPHELRLLRLLVEGHSYKSAAGQLGVSRHTVSFHLRSIYDKLQVHTKSAAVAKALRTGLTS